MAFPPLGCIAAVQATNVFPCTPEKLFIRSLRVAAKLSGDGSNKVHGGHICLTTLSQLYVA